MPRLKKIVTVLDAIAADGTSAAVDVKSFYNLLLSIGSVTASDLTIKVKGAIADKKSDVDFSAAASETNQWDYAQVIEREDNTPFDGDEGVVISGKGCRIFGVNTDGYDYMAIEVSSYVAGTVTAFLRGYNNS